MWASLASVGAAIVGAFGSLFRWMTQSDARRAAKAEGQAEILRDTIKDVDESNKARHRLRDPRESDRVRKKFSRPPGK